MPAVVWLLAGFVILYAAGGTFGSRSRILIGSIALTVFLLALLTVTQSIRGFDVFRFFQHSSMAIGRMRATSARWGIRIS